MKLSDMLYCAPGLILATVLLLCVPFSYTFGTLLTLSTISLVGGTIGIFLDFKNK